MDHAPTEPTGANAAQTAIDPVCGMTVTLKDGTRSEPFGNQTFHFCSEKCQTKFKADPWFYASGKVPPKDHGVAQAAQYTCPMHPQILQDKPGNCPICGMTLEPVVASDEVSPELANFTRRMSISTAAAVPLITSYFVTGQAGIAGLTRLAQRGVRISLLTNALSATDMLLVYGADRRYRGALLAAGL